MKKFAIYWLFVSGVKHIVKQCDSYASAYLFCSINDWCIRDSNGLAHDIDFIE